MNHHYAFRNAAENGDVETLKYLAAQLPRELPAMIKADDYYAFRNAAGNGHVETLKYLAAQLPKKLPAMIKDSNYFAFRYAAKYGQVETLKYLAAQLPDELPAMIVAHDYSALRGTFSVQSYLLRFPLAFSYAELHYEERWAFGLKSFMNELYRRVRP